MDNSVQSDNGSNQLDLFTQLAEKTAKAVAKKFEQRLTRIEREKDLEIWVEEFEARRILKINCSKKMKRLREQNEIMYTQNGKTFLYERRSLYAYLRRRSNLLQYKRKSDKS